MKRVLLLGDSIRCGYDEFVREALTNEAEVLFDEDNGRFAAYTLWQVNQLFRRYGHFDVVHWNNGYWDMHIEAPMTEPIHPLPEYRQFLRRILTQIRQNGAQAIFATSVPVMETEGFAYRDEWVRDYNAAARAVMAEADVPVNDLYALCKTDSGCFKCADHLHLTEEGYRACARQTADHIRRYL